MEKRYKSKLGGGETRLCTKWKQILTSLNCLRPGGEGRPSNLPMERGKKKSGEKTNN